MGFGEDAGMDQGIEGIEGAGYGEIVELAEDTEGVVKHGRLAIENDGEGEGALGAETGTGDERVEEGADGVKGAGIGDLGDGDREGDAV